MKGSPGSLIGPARQELRKKRFPRRFSPSARTRDRCTSSSTFRDLHKIVRAAVQVTASELFAVFFRPCPEHALQAQRIQKPIQSDRDPSRFGWEGSTGGHSKHSSPNGQSYRRLCRSLIDCLFALA